MYPGLFQSTQSPYPRSLPPPPCKAKTDKQRARCTHCVRAPALSTHAQPKTSWRCACVPMTSRVSPLTNSPLLSFSPFPALLQVTMVLRLSLFHLATEATTSNLQSRAACRSTGPTVCPSAFYLSFGFLLSSHPFVPSLPPILTPPYPTRRLCCDKPHKCFHLVQLVDSTLIPRALLFHHQDVLLQKNIACSAANASTVGSSIQARCHAHLICSNTSVKWRRFSFLSFFFFFQYVSEIHPFWCDVSSYLALLYCGFGRMFIIMRGLLPFEGPHFFL